MHKRRLTVEKKSVAKKVFGIIGTVFFFASYIPYICIIAAASGGVQAGLIGGPYIYGFEAMLYMLQWFCIIPVVPVCLIYQLIFGIAYIRKHRILSIITLVLASLIVAALLLVGLPDEIKKKVQLKTDSSVIISNLEEKYGHEMASDISMTVFDHESHGYKVTSSVLPEGSYFYVYLGAEYYDDLINVFTRENKDYPVQFKDYVNRKYNLPENVSFRENIESIDFRDYKNGDDYTVLFDRTNYSINAIEIETDELNDDIVISIVNDAWNKYFSQISIPDDTKYLIVYITKDGKYSFSASITPDKENPSALISTYHDYPFASDLNGQRISLVQQ